MYSSWCGKWRARRGDGARDRLDQLGQRPGSCSARVDGAVGLLSGAELLDRLLQLAPARVGLSGGVGDGLNARERRLGGPVDEVEPERLVVELADAVVAEEVGVGEHDDAPRAVLHHGGERGAGRRGGREGAGDHLAAVAQGERPGAVEAGALDPGEQVDRRMPFARPPLAALSRSLAVPAARRGPRGGGVEVRVVLDGAVLDLDAEAGRGGRSGCCRTCPARVSPRAIRPPPRGRTPRSRRARRPRAAASAS